MRNFETPKMNISMFAAENVATTASTDAISGQNAVNARTAFAGENVQLATQIFEFNYNN